MGLPEDEAHGVIGRVRATPEHLKSRGVETKIVILTLAAASTWLSVFFLEILMGGLDKSEIKLSQSQLIAFTVTGFVILAFIARDVTIRYIAVGHDFAKIYYFHRAGMEARRITFVLVAPLFLVLLAAVMRPDLAYVVYSVPVIAVLTYLPVPLFLYFDVFSVEALASLCLAQALVSQNLSQNPWIRRGLRAAARRLEDLLIHTSPRRLLFGINLKLLKGEPIDGIIARISSGIVKIYPSDIDDDRQACSDLYLTIRDLDREVDFAASDGVGMVPSYSEKATATWDILTKSSHLIYIVFLALALLIFVLAGRLPQFPALW